MQDILSKLNEVQQEAVLYNDGPSLVIAGAGAGKTRVLTYKIAALLKLGYKPQNLLALTFTNKAAREMKSRIAQTINEKEVGQLWMGTFHSIFSRILRIDGDVLGFNSNYTIYDQTDARNRIKQIVKDLELDDKKYDAKKIQWRISSLKNRLITPTSYQNKNEERFVDIGMPRLGEIYRIYMNDCHRDNVMDFDDILLYTNVLFRDYKDILKKYQELFQFVLVDEYQDTNLAQHVIIQKLCEKHHHICVVGDDAQSIYSFRGANIENILHFKDYYPEYRLFKLEQNYRSTQNVVNVANSLISKNAGQIKKNVFSNNEVGNKVKVIATDSDDFESSRVCDILKRDLKGFKYEDSAILYRTRAQSRKFEESLLKNGIPYVIYGGLSFFDQKVVKDILAYFRLIVNLNDEEALLRAIKYPRKGIGDTTLSKIREISIEKNLSMWNVISDLVGNNVDIGAAAIKRIYAFRDKIEALTKEVDIVDAYSLATRVVKDFGLLEELAREQSEEGKENLKVADEVLHSVYDFIQEHQEDNDSAVSIADYLQSVSLLTDMDTKQSKNKNVVTLMTIHSSKGLEFKNVIVVGLEEELFPSGIAMREGELEEERRLFYVAITRAEKNCFITYARSRFRNGKTYYPSPSRFLGDIDSSLLDFEESSNNFGNSSKRFFYNSSSDNNEFDFYKFRGKKSPQISGFNANNRPSYGSQSTTTVSITPTQSRGSLKRITTTTQEPDAPNLSGFEVGEKVLHERFGKGIISNIENLGNDYKLTILFDQMGERNILKKYANLKKI